MDILSHTCTGLAVGTVVASFVKDSRRHQFFILIASILGGAFPDMDVISLWSGFDSTIGTWLGLETTGREIYFEKYWYSHHGALHSLFTAIIIPILFVLCRSFFQQDSNTFIQTFFDKLQRTKLILIAFCSAYIFHLIEDMPTPGLSWGGVNFFFPSESYTGGLSKIWWWNNYDIFLIICSVVFINIVLLAFRKYISKFISALTLLVFLLGFGLSVYQISQRGELFEQKLGSNDFHLYEKRSLEIQKKILGERIYRVMVTFDRIVPVNF